MTIIEDANKYLHEEPTAFMTKERRLERSAVLIEKLIRKAERLKHIESVTAYLNEMGASTTTFMITVAGKEWLLLGKG